MAALVGGSAFHQAEKECLLCNRFCLVGQRGHLLFVERREVTGKLDTLVYLLHGIAAYDRGADRQRKCVKHRFTFGSVCRA